MIRDKSEYNKETIIDLNGQGGNAFVLLTYAKEYSKQLGLDFEKIEREMKESDYENLITVFDKYFGDFVILER